MAEPAKEDFAVLSSRIEQLSRSLPHLRSRVQATQQVLDVASGVLHRVQSVKQRLLDQHHHATLKIPIATRTTNRRRSSVSSSDTKSEVCTPVDSPHSQASSLHFDSASTRFDSLEEAIDADSIPVALTSKESVERLSRLSDLLREQEPRVSAATADWRKYVCVCSSCVCVHPV